MRKLVFGVSDLVRHKMGCATTGESQRLEISDLGLKRIYTIYVAKTKQVFS